jgi:DNA-binding transcriptional LysR family regulator
VTTYANAMQIARHSDVLGLVPRSAIDDHPARMGLEVFELPVKTSDITVSAIWHPRLHADPAHRWLRDVVFGICQR